MRRIAEFAYRLGKMARGDMARAEHPKEIFSTHEAAKICKVTPMTVIRWIKEGKLEAFTTAGGHRRILYENLARFCAARRIPFVRESATELGRILVVDSDAEVREAVSEAIRAVDSRFAVELAGDAFAAGRLLAEFRPTLLFIEHRLAGVDTLELAARLAHDADAPVGVVGLVAGHAHDAERAWRSRGAFGTIEKPPDPSAVDRMVRLAFHLPVGQHAPTIALLDKDSRSVRALRHDLEERMPGTQVATYDSVLELAFAIAAELPDVLLIDAASAELDVVSLVRHVVTRGAGAPDVIVLASARQELVATPILAAGARAVLVKPVTVNDVLDVLKRGGKRRPATR